MRVVLIISFIITPFADIQGLSINTNLQSFEDITRSLDEIKIDMEQAECGGWIPFDESLNMSVENYISQVSGVPGRSGDALGNIKSGMGKREDEPNDFTYPDSAAGFTSACRPGSPWFYEEHPCQRPGPDINPMGDGTKIYKNGEKANSDPLNNNVQWTCDALCDDLNRRWRYLVWTESCPGEEEGTVEISTSESACYDSDTQSKPNAPTPGEGCSLSEEWRFCCTKSAEAPNCVQCAGEDCRGEHQEIGENLSANDPYVSYYRRYEGTCTRDALPTAFVPNDDITFSQVPVSCYGLYNEYDTKTQASIQNEYKCIIANTYPNKNFELTHMWQTQKPDMNNVEIGEKTSEDFWIDPPSEDYQISAQRTFDENKDIWYKKLGGGFFITNKTPLEDKSWDLSSALLSPGESEFKTYPQLSDNQRFSSGSLIRAFDDSVSFDRGEKRTFVEWWQDLETQMHTLLTPARIRLILPVSWKMGLDVKDAFLYSDTKLEMEQNTKSLEILLQAKEDLLGEIASYFENSMLLKIQEEPVPILVPLADPVELRAHANLWCAWYITQENKKLGEGADIIKNCDSVSGEVGLIITRLREYADRIDDVRMLRADLYHYEGNLLERQKAILAKIEEWYKNNLDKYDEYMESLKTLDEIRDKWKEIQDGYRDFHDVINMPWCLNERFTLPIYSLLDDGGKMPTLMDKDTFWFPGREMNGNLADGIDDVLTADNNPMDFSSFPRLYVDAKEDIILDFSKIETVKNAVLLPVLKPIQVRIDWSRLAAPRKEDDNPTLPDPLPPLPAIPWIRDIVRSELAKIHFGEEPPDISSKIPEPRLSIPLEFFRRIEDIISRMSYSYAKFWKSVTLDPEEVKDGTEEDCFLSIPCIHTEMDLLERFQRICARPGVLLNEDFMSTGNLRDVDALDGNTCQKNDWACEIQKGEIWYPSEGWQVISPNEEDQQKFIDMLRVKLFMESLQSGEIPYEIDRAKILPSFETGGTEDILIINASSQSSNQ